MYVGGEGGRGGGLYCTSYSSIINYILNLPIYYIIFLSIILYSYLLYYIPIYYIIFLSIIYTNRIVE